jgi:hypothetical protein
MNAVREIAGFLRWRLVPVRYAGKVRRSLPGATPRRTPPRSPQAAMLEQSGWAPGPSIPPAVLERIQAKYFARGASVVPKASGHPFTSLFHGDDISADDPVCQMAFSPEVLDAAHEYFGGRFRFNSIQLMYSWPTNGELQQSQMWHKDYGDSNSFHWVAYLVDVLDEQAGPFVFVDKKDTQRIGKSAFIRRIDDETFVRELGDGEIRTFYGKAGEAVFVDPSVCYHFGSRCKQPRLALFITFSTDTPFTVATDLIMDHREKLIETAAAIRPDLSKDYIRAILTI